MNENRIRKETTTSPMAVSRVYVSDFQKEGTLTAELKQTVTTKSFYPSKSVTNSLQDNPFSASEFGFEEQEFENKETRVAWIDVPLGTTMEQVAERLAAKPGCTLYRILSNKPIITDNQQYAIDNPDLNVTLDTFANRQAVRYPEGAENAGKLALDVAGKVQYRAVFFSSKPIEDIDRRTSEMSDSYLSVELKAELNETHHVVSGQTL